MPLSDLTDPAAVDAAMNEFDRIGRDNFLHKYGFGPSRAYFVSRDGKYYDSKAIVGAAHRYQYPQKGQLRADNFSGGENTVRAKLEAVKADPGTGIRTFHPWVFRRSASTGGNSDDGYQP